ncbi:MAG: VCBS repeat-containing protein [Thermoanaerobaculia bacterium]|nr:VCBS repeat-containing protein [Thermoanaerobaculia bacterium]
MTTRALVLTLCLAVAAPLGAAEPPSQPADERVDVLKLSVVEMLARIAEGGQSMFNNERRAAALEDELRRATDVRQKVGIGFTLAQELLALGRTEEALSLLLEIRGVFERPGSNVHPDLLRQLGDRLAVAYLRLGEQDNCIAIHTAASCLLPISPEGRHRIERGSRGAKAELEALLRVEPELGYRWLLNLAAMTLGEYPDGVAPEWRIPPETFASEYPLARFHDVAGATGTDVFGTSGGVVIEDLDGDGRLDLMVSAWGVKEQLVFLRNRGDGTFEDRTKAAGIIGEYGGLNLVHADYDNDGDADVLVLRGAWLGPDGLYPDSLLQNQGDGTFKNVTREAGLLSFFPNQAAAFADYDLDGRLDLFVGNETMPGINSPCQLFHANPDGTFTNVAAQVGVDVEGFVKGAAWGDVDDDAGPIFICRALASPTSSSATTARPRTAAGVLPRSPPRRGSPSRR